MTSVIGFGGPYFFGLSSESKPRFRVQGRSLSNQDASVLSSDSIVVNGASVVGEREGSRPWVDHGNGSLRHKVKDKQNIEDGVLESLEPLWDDGYGTVTVKDYFDASEEMIKPDGGPPRWFSPLARNPPLKDSPVLLFLPGLDDSTPVIVGLARETWHFKRSGLVKLVEDTIRLEHASSPNKPIYLVGDSFGGCLSLAVAARNPTIDLVLILVNPATSMERSQLLPLFPILEALPDELHIGVPYLLSFVM
ncbi:PREDICTED: acyltransferase-like protein At1g54570, chloroplastic-like, partial [Fragaria vesca subsp. vesca]